MQPMRDAFQEMLDTLTDDDPELQLRCKALQDAQLARNAHRERARKPPTMDGKPFEPRFKTVVDDTETVPALGPPLHHLHNGTEMWLLAEDGKTYLPHGEGYRCLTCRDSGWVRRDVPFGDTDFGKPVKCACRLNDPATMRAQMLRRRAHSGFPEALESCTFDTFRTIKGTEGAKDAVQATVELFRAGAELPRWVAVSGPPGVGKTHLLSAATQELLMLTDVCWAELPEFLDQCKATTTNPVTGETRPYALDELLTKRAMTTPVLVLDRVGGQLTVEWDTKKVETILMHRYQAKLWTFLAIEATLHEIEAWSSRLYSRLKDRRFCHLVSIVAADYRQNGKGNGR